ncbi:MAG: 50S ribosomal protein L18 [Candidatus Omnitrophica bacterium]|nr:50S ribosomal protein L18 [Candidatus Omnitrophota bacterium]
MSATRLTSTLEPRQRRHQRLRKRVVGTPDRPRLAVFRSLKHLYAQIINDLDGKTLVAASTLDEAMKKVSPKHGGNVAAAKALGLRIAELAREKRIARVVFDRGGYLYHGRVQALAEAARSGGLEF